MKYKVDTKELQAYTKSLKQLTKSAFPLAIRGTINDLAFHTSKNAKDKTLRQNFTLRNSYIKKSVQYTRSKPIFNIEQMQSEAGQKANFLGNNSDELRKQELGKSDKPTGKYLKMGLASVRNSNSMARQVKVKERLNKEFYSQTSGESKGMAISKAISKAHNGRTKMNKGTIPQKKKQSRAITAYALIDSKTGSGKTLLRIKTKAKSRDLTITPVYKYSKTRPIKPRQWLRQATEWANSKRDYLYIENAKKQEQRVMKQFGITK